MMNERLDVTGMQSDIMSASLDRLYQFLREAHAEREQVEWAVTSRTADLEAARKELEKATYLRDRTRKRIEDIELAIVDRRRAERGVGALASPPIPVDPHTGAPTS